MDILRSPDERFASLPGYPFTPRYTQVEGLRVHYLDEGPSDAEVVLLLHGEPSWSYLYRKLVPILVDAGLRAVAPDLVGFGRSDKPARREEYTYQRHVDWLRGFLEAVPLRDITLERFEKPFLTAFSDLDPITRGMETVLQKRIPGARGRPHPTICGGGHFLQEDRGGDLARGGRFVRRTAGYAGRVQPRRRWFRR
jgi:pimeloyl-ACP methyl ester carboxylesterase